LVDYHNVPDEKPATASQLFLTLTISLFPVFVLAVQRLVEYHNEPYDKAVIASKA
jgi:hypothetical protein